MAQLAGIALSISLGAAERGAWLKHLTATLNAAPLAEEHREALRQFFTETSAYVIGEDAGSPKDGELANRWSEQLSLDAAIAAIECGRDQEAQALAARFAPRPAVFTGLLARMVRSGGPTSIGFAMDALERDPSLMNRRFGGRALLHYASGAGCLEIVELMLRLGADPDVLDGGNHTALYSVANECASAAGPEIVKRLVGARADVNACGGVTRATPLHMAARRGHVEIARALLDCGAAIDARDRKGDTPLQRAMNCRREDLARLLRERGAGGHCL